MDRCIRLHFDYIELGKRFYWHGACKSVIFSFKNGFVTSASFPIYSCDGIYSESPTRTHPNINVADYSSDTQVEYMSIFSRVEVSPFNFILIFNLSFERVVIELVARLTDIDSGVREEAFSILSSLPQSALSRASIDSTYASSLV